ncbi:ABC transporter permease [Leucobacter chinensis]|uniref:ABC transporter permease n=1 Tax=Leucobacter chinensis TaxID=2851010 RepID=UPI001C24BBBD
MKTLFRSPSGVISTLLLIALAVLAVLGPDGFGPTATTVDMMRASEGPSAGHLLGTDGLGRDILTRTLAAARLSLVLGVTAVLIAVVLGSLLGAVLAASGRRVRSIGAAIIDTMLSFGDILLGVVVVTILGVGAKGAVIAIGIAFTPIFARFTFALVSSTVARDYVAAARVLGVKRRSILSRYVLRNVSDSIIVTSFSAVGEGIIALSSLSFLGLGVQEPQFDWGQMLTDGVRNFYLNPWAAVAPAVLIGLTGLALSMFGDALAKATNPLLRAKQTATRRPQEVAV